MAKSRKQAWRAKKKPQRRKALDAVTLVDHHIIRSALQVGGHLVGDGRQRVADDLKRDRVEGFAALRLFLRTRSKLSEFGHHTPPTSMISSPERATRQVSPLNSTVVVPCSSISAGPAMRAPAPRSGRW